MKQTIKKPLQFVAALLPLMIVGSILAGLVSCSDGCIENMVFNMQCSDTWDAILYQS